MQHPREALLAASAAALATLAACASQSPTTPEPHPVPAPDAAPAPEPEPEEPPPQLTLERLDFSDLEGWKEDHLAEALPALGRSCRAIARKKKGAPLGIYPVAGTPEDWAAPCRALRRARSDAETRALLEKYFVPYRASNHGDAVGRFTGYYQAHMTGSRKKSRRFHVPVWGRPRDLVSVNIGDFIPSLRGERVWGKLSKSGTRLVPYETRHQINRGALRGRARVLFWVDDPIDRFFAQVQGSANVDLDGKTIQVGVGGKNGHIYTAIGRVLIHRGELTRETVSMQSIRRWIEKHPKKASELMEKNQAFIFFSEHHGPGPTGSQGVVLTGGRSLAVDRRWLPLGLPLWLETEVPVPGKDGATQPFRRLMIAQDTGGAIRGPVRGDIYFGATAEAADQAGRMKGTGTYALLIPRGAALPDAVALTRR